MDGGDPWLPSRGHAAAIACPRRCLGSQSWCACESKWVPGHVRDIFLASLSAKERGIGASLEQRGGKSKRRRCVREREEKQGKEEESCRWGRCVIERKGKTVGRWV